MSVIIKLKIFKMMRWFGAGRPGQDSGGDRRGGEAQVRVEGTEERKGL